MTVPDFATLTRLEEQALDARLKAVRAAITHAGEKGRALEHSASQLIREMLPAEYGLATGFIAYRAGAAIALSRQLDIIIYDAVRTGPLARLGACEVFPLEAVYGYVEIKASLRSSSDDAEQFADDSIEHCLQLNYELREMKERWFHSVSMESPVGSERKPGSKVSIRSYLMAFSAEGAIASDPDAFAQRMANVTARLGDPAHFHGVLIANTGFFKTRPVRPKTPANQKWFVDYVTENCLAVFKADLLHDLARFPRFGADQTPALEDYFGQRTWRTRSPEPSFIVHEPEA